MSTFSKKKFIIAAEAYCLKQRNEWIAAILVAGLEASAIEYCRREGFILPTSETLEDVGVNSIFPDIDIVARANAVHLGAFDITELEAKLAISAAVKAGIAEANAGICAISISHPPCVEGAFGAVPQGAAPVTLAPGTKERGTDAASALPMATVEAVRGTPEGVATTNIRLHVFKVAETSFYTTDKAVLEYVQAAQVQGVVVNVVWLEGEHGRRALSVKLA